MDEKLLPQGTIECDAVTVHPPPTAVGVGGGFPCQAGPAGFTILLFKFDGNQSVNFVFACLLCLSMSISVCWQGCSTAGGQQGLKDARTSLVTNLFRVFDLLPEHEQTLSFSFACKQVAAIDSRGSDDWGSLQLVLGIACTWKRLPHFWDPSRR